MVNENIIPKTETVYELKEKYKTPSFEEFMQSYEYDNNLNYADLNGRDIGTPKGYGPCEYSGCPYSINCRFYVKIGLSSGELEFRERTSDGIADCFSWLTMRNIQQVRNVLNKFEQSKNEIGSYYVSERPSVFFNEWDNSTRNAVKKTDEVKQWLHEQVKKHEAGEDVYVARKDFSKSSEYDKNDDPSGCGVIM